MYLQYNAPPSLFFFFFFETNVRISRCWFVFWFLKTFSASLNSLTFFFGLGKKKIKMLFVHVCFRTNNIFLWPCAPLEDLSMVQPHRSGNDVGLVPESSTFWLGFVREKMILLFFFLFFESLAQIWRRIESQR